MSTLFPELEVAVTRSTRHRDVELLHRLECKACPLAQLPNKHPNMPATGSDQPLVYILGEGPGKDEDELNRQFVGESGRMLRPRIPSKFKDRVRFNNVVRTRPYKNETPSQQAIECCRPSVIRDIEQTKPKAIFGFGNVPLQWVMPEGTLQGISMWRGRRMPVKIGTHSCWYYALQHPAYFLRPGYGGEGKASKEEEQRIWKLDIARAFDQVDSGLPKPVVHTPQMVWAGIEALTTFGEEGLDRIAEVLEWAEAVPDIGIDYETDRLRPYEPDALVLSAAVSSRERTFAFGIDHPEAEWTVEERKEVRQLWRRFLKRAKGKRWVHNAAFELEWSGVKFGADLIRTGNWQDTAVQAAILDERKGKNKPGCFSLEFLVQQRFGFNLKKLTNLDRSKLVDAPLELVLRYNGADSKYHCYLGIEQEVDIEEEGLEGPYRLALRRVPTVVLTQMKGIPIDQREVKRLQKKYQQRIEITEEKIFALPVIKKFEQVKGYKFLPFSNPDVMFVFKDMLRRKECIVEDKYTKKVKYSADKKILDQIDHPLAGLLIDLRESSKRKSTYIDPLDGENPETAIYSDGLQHCTFNTIFPETGRLSAESLNWQNFPKRDDEAKEVRKQVRAPPGHLIAAFDYGQIEARVIAMFTRDKVFVKALWENYDVHMEWAERLARVYPARVGGKKNFTDKKVMKDFRTDIKNQWTFPLFFGAKLESAAGYLQIPVEVLRPQYNEFWRIFSTTKDWQEDIVTFYNKYGYVECLTKRRRRGPLSLNQIINSPVQGTAAEIVMDGMCRLSETGDPEQQPEINIHDDLTYVRVPTKRIDEVAEKIISGMLAVPFPWVNVPISVEMSVGENWLEMEEFGTFYSNTWFKR